MLFRSPDAHAAPEQFRVYPVGAAWYAAYVRLKPAIDAIASQLSRDRPQLRDELVQIGLIALWELDPSRYRAKDLPFLKRGIEWQMQMFARKWTGRKRILKEEAKRIGAAPVVEQEPFQPSAYVDADEDVVDGAAEEESYDDEREEAALIMSQL